MDSIRDSQKLGRLLIQEGVIRVDQLQVALENQKRSGESLGQVLISMGALDALQLAVILARQFEDQRVQVRTGEVISFMGCKGGVGTTFLAVNTALGLAGTGRRVCILDFQFTLPQVHLFLNELKPGTTLSHITDLPAELEADALLSHLLINCRDNLSMVVGPGSIAAAEGITDLHVQRLVSAARRSFDYVIIDLSTEFNDRNIPPLDMSDRIVLVSDASVPSISNAMRILELTRKLSYPDEKVIPLIGNYQTGDLALAEMKKYFQQDVKLCIRSDKERVSASINHARPVMEKIENTALHGDLAGMINALVDRPLLQTPKVSGFWQRMFSSGSPGVPAPVQDSGVQA